VVITVKAIHPVPFVSMGLVKGKRSGKVQKGRESVIKFRKMTSVRGFD